MRLAWFSPWPPQRSGIAGRSAELVPLLAGRGHAIDVFVHSPRGAVARRAGIEAPAEGSYRVIDAHDFVWRHDQAHYELTVYQLGNSHVHRYMWPYLFQYPGLTVLHDARLHHARAEALLSSGRTADYVVEFAWNHPDVPPAGANFGALGVDGVFYYQWPMLRSVLETSRMVAAHSRGVAERLGIEHVALGEGPRNLDVRVEREAFRQAHGIPPQAVVFGVFGGLTAEKRIIEVLAAFEATRAWVPGARLILAGAADPVLGLDDRIAALKISDSVTRLPAAGDEEFDRAIAASDVVLNLRWPTAEETSGPWVRSLALSRATVTIDLPHQTHVPALDPRTWARHTPCEDLAPGADERAITVSIDLRDLNHSLRAAMRRLGTDDALRSRLGAAARRWWEREHTMERMAGDFERVMAQALARPAPSAKAGWPAHLRPDPAAYARSLLGHDAWREVLLRLE